MFKAVWYIYMKRTAYVLRSISSLQSCTSLCSVSIVMFGSWNWHSENYSRSSTLHEWMTFINSGAADFLAFFFCVFWGTTLEVFTFLFICLLLHVLCPVSRAKIDLIDHLFHIRIFLFLHPLCDISLCIHSQWVFSVMYFLMLVM